MRYEKAELVLRVAIDMQGLAYGLTLEDIRYNYTGEPLSRRTAERLRDAVERLFPQLEVVKGNNSGFLRRCHGCAFAYVAWGHFCSAGQHEGSQRQRRLGCRYSAKEMW